MSCFHPDSLVDKAKLYATAAHGAVGQKRKYTGEDYINHPINVANIIVDNIKYVSTNIVAAAYLHDVVEDTELTVADIRYTFGLNIAKLVDEVTDVYVDPILQGNRETRKALERSRISTISSDAKTVKLADIIDNSRDIVKTDPDFARTYIQEKMALLEVLMDGNKVLWDMAYDSLTQAVEHLKNA